MTATARKREETTLLARIRLALGRDRRVVLWRNNVGVAESRGVRKIRYGVGGSGGADLIGIASGRFVALEVKILGENPTSEQRQFLSLVNARGGYACVVRSIADALSAIDSACFDLDAPPVT